MTDDFTSDAIFLLVKGEGAEGGSEDVSFRSCGEVKFVRSSEQLDVFVFKWRRLRCADCIFARSTEEEKGNDDHVSNNMQPRIIGCCCYHADAAEDSGWNRLDSIWWGVCFRVGF